MSKTILVVDDEPAVTDLLAYNLRKANYTRRQDSILVDNHIQTTQKPNGL